MLNPENIRYSCARRPNLSWPVHVVKLGLSLLLLFLSTQHLHAQQNIQLHTDRDYYFPGDTVWYKAYLAHKGIPDTAVKNIAVAIGRHNREVLEQQLRPVAKGATFGQYVIPGDFKEHEIFFNLYTKRNESKPYATKIAVYQKNKVVSDSKPTVKVFVQGNGVMPGAENELFFQWNIPDEIRARICDEHGTQIATFRTDARGRASIACKPEKAPVFLHWSYQGKEYVDPVPTCTTRARLHLEQSGDTAILVVENRSTFRNATLRFMPEPDITWQKDLHFGWENVQTFPLEELLGGAYAGDFVLVYQDSVLASMRTDHFRPVEPQLAVNKLSFEHFGENSFDILIPDDNVWNLSISVQDGLLPAPMDDFDPLAYQTVGRYRYSYPKPEEEDFTDAFYTLKGRIKMPEREWDRFWEARSKRQQQLEKEGRPLKGVSFGYRLSTEADYRYEEVQYDSTGNLKLRDITFYDTLLTRVVQIDDHLKVFPLQTEWQFSDLPPVEQVLIPDFVTGLPRTHLYTGRFDPDYYTFPSGDRAIKEVAVSRKKIDPRIEKLQKQFSKGWFDRESVMDIDLLHEDIPSYVFTLGELTEYLKNKYPLIRRYGGMILANNVHARDKSWIGGDMPLDVTEIVFVRVYEKYIQNPSGGGAIMYYTSGVNARNKDIGVAKIALSKVPGYSVFHDFHHKKYDGGNLPEYDDRQTLYWNPDIQLTGRVRFPVAFFNNTLSDAYTVTVQGMSGSGKTIRFSKKITKSDLDKD